MERRSHFSENLRTQFTKQHAEYRRGGSVCADLVCPKCGASSKETSFVGVFCARCKAKELSERIAIPKLQILHCKKCGKFKVKKWVENLAQLKSQLLSLLKGPFEKAVIMALNESESTCKVDFIFRELRISKMIPIKIIHTICDECAKVARGYYEALIQIRGSREEVSKLTEAIVQRLMQRTFISTIKEFPFGIDIYTGSHSATAAVLSELKLRAKISRKLHGVKAGKRLFRITFLIKI